MRKQDDAALTSVDSARVRWLAKLVTPAFSAAIALSGCRPIVRACSADDPCPAHTVCVGGRCEVVDQPTAITTTERLVLAPRRLRQVSASSSEPVVLVEFDLAGVELDRVVEAHVLATLEGTPPAKVRLHRLSGGWDEGSTSVGSALGHVGRVDSEQRLQPGAARTVRLPVSRASLRAQREHG